MKMHYPNQLEEAINYAQTHDEDLEKVKEGS